MEHKGMDRYIDGDFIKGKIYEVVPVSENAIWR